MKDSLILVRIDSDYCNYLRKFDNKVPYNFNDKELRPFIGVLFQINNLMYFAPLSSPKPKHLKLKSKLDFLKIDNGKLGAINFNNMLPVTKRNIMKLDLDKKCITKKEEKYINATLDQNIAKRCCNFKLLEKKCKEYNK